MSSGFFPKEPLPYLAIVNVLEQAFSFWIALPGLTQACEGSCCSWQLAGWQGNALATTGSPTLKSEAPGSDSADMGVCWLDMAFVFVFNFKLKQFPSLKA